MWTCYNCGNSKNLDAEDSCGLCEKIRRKDSITTEDDGIYMYMYSIYVYMYICIYVYMYISY